MSRTTRRASPCRTSIACAQRWATSGSISMAVRTERAVAQHYLRRFPTHTRSVILDGVVAPEQILGPETALDAENALIDVLARCASDTACKEKFGDPAEAYRALRKSLDAKPVSVTLPDPTTGTPRNDRVRLAAARAGVAALDLQLGTGVVAAARAQSRAVDPETSRRSPASS